MGKSYIKSWSPWRKNNTNSSFEVEQTMKPKIYIAGKITSDPDYKAKFEEAENFYKKNGLHRTHTHLSAHRYAAS